MLLGTDAGMTHSALRAKDAHAMLRQEYESAEDTRLQIYFPADDAATFFHIVVGTIHRTALPRHWLFLLFCFTQGMFCPLPCQSAHSDAKIAISLFMSPISTDAAASPSRR